jgi:Tol biopolymer transport system component
MIAMALSVNPVFAQKKGAKPSPPPPSLQNSAIVYVSGDSIKVADADGSNQVTLITKRSTHFGAPSWAPDGDKIIFNSNHSGEGIYEIVINRANGQIGAPQKILAHSAGILATPRWSQVATVNGRSLIAYEDFPPGSIQTDIYVFDPAAPVIEGINPFSLTNTPTISELTPSWSPDAKKLVVKTMVNNNPSIPYDVEILTLGTECGENGPPVCEVSSRRSLVQQVLGSPLINGSPIMNTNWANMGNNIAVSALTPPDQNSDIWVIEFDDVSVVANNLTNTNSSEPPDRHETVPTWSPDNSQIMYMGWDYLCQAQSNRKRGYNLIIRNVDESDIDNCEEKMIVEGDARMPSWWRGGVAN